MHEGLASYFEPGDPALAVRVLKAARVFIPLSSLEGGFVSLTPAQAAIAYQESLLAADVLMQRVGTRAGVLLQYIGSGQSVPQAFRIFGLEMAAFEEMVKSRVK